MVWNEETVLYLTDLWTQGHSTAEIGRRLGVSKNAIVGKAHRLDLAARPSPIRRDASRPASERPQALPRVEGPTLPPLASAIAHPASVSPGVRLAQPAGPAPAQVSRSSVDATPRKTPALFASTAPVSATAPPRREIGQGTSSQGTMGQGTPPLPRRAAPCCCWPIGEPGTRDFRFCDDASLPGKPYCDEHAKLAYVKIRDRRENAA